MSQVQGLLRVSKQLNLEFVECTGALCKTLTFEFIQLIKYLLGSPHKTCVVFSSRLLMFLGSLHFNIEPDQTAPLEAV